LLGPLVLVQAMMLLRRGIEARVWNDESLLFPVCGAFMMSYIAFAGAVEMGMVMLGFQAPADPFADLTAGWSELRQGNLKAFLSKAIPRRVGEPTFGFGNVRLRPSVWRVTLLLGTGILAFWAGRILETEVGNHVFWTFVFALLCGVGTNGLYWGAQGDRRSKTVAWVGGGALWSGLVWATVITPMIVIAAIGSREMKPLFVQAGVGAALGMGASLFIVQWKQRQTKD
jgi:hypothetical protein